MFGGASQNPLFVCASYINPKSVYTIDANCEVKFTHSLHYIDLLKEIKRPETFFLWYGKKK